MATQINVTVGGGELPAQAKRGQEGNRWRLEERERNQQTTAQRQAAEQQQQAAQATGADPRRALGQGAAFGYRPDELAANRFGGEAFLVIGNVNGLRDDVFDVFIDSPVTGNFVKQPGSADFSSDREYTYYLWTATGMPVDRFVLTRGGKAVLDYFTQSGSGSPTLIVWRGAERLTGVKIRPRQNYKLKMIVTRANNNGNFGQIITGFTNASRIGTDEYIDGSLNVGDEVTITQRTELWGDPLP